MSQYRHHFIANIVCIKTQKAREHMRINLSLATGVFKEYTLIP
jgi:hypothetical protein